MLGYFSFARRHLRFVAFGFAMAFFSSFGQTFFVGLFGEEIRGDFGLTDASFGTIYSLATLASAASLVWLGRLIDFVDLRLYSGMVGLGLVVACLAMGAAPTALALGFALYLLRVSGQGLMSHTAITSMSRYFGRDRGKAISIAGMGFAAGEAVLPIGAVALMASFGWRATWIGLGCGLALGMLPLIQWLLKGHARRHGTFMEGNGETTTAATTERHWTRSQVLADPRFYLVLPAVLSPGFIMTGFFFHQVHLCDAKGWSLAWYASCFIGFAAAQMPSALLAGGAIDRLGARRLLPLFLIPLAAAMAVAFGVNAAAGALVFLLLAGVTSGVSGPIVSAMWAEMYGTRHLGAIRAMVTALGVLATALSPAGMGWLIGRGVTMEQIAMSCLILILIAIGLTVFVRKADVG